MKPGGVEYETGFIFFRRRNPKWMYKKNFARKFKKNCLNEGTKKEFF